jgi:hypothetical protein
MTMGRNARTIVGLLAAGFGAASAAPDEVLLRGGGRVTGVVVERTPDAIVIETGPGRVTLQARRVERIVEGRSALQSYYERAASLAPDDALGWAALARWAAERDLVTPSREAWRRVLSVDPSHPEANAALGRVEVGGAWLSEEEGYRARGYVPFEGRWVTPAEHEALVRERAAEEASGRERREAELRVREAEARAREAEARAREAEMAAQPIEDGGIPLWWGWGGVAPLLPFDPGPDHPHPRPPITWTTPLPKPPSSIQPPRPTPPPRRPMTKPGAIEAPPTPRPGPD